jgi:hypothetical protein
MTGEQVELVIAKTLESRARRERALADRSMATAAGVPQTAASGSGVRSSSSRADPDAES